MAVYTFAELLSQLPGAYEIGFEWNVRPNDEAPRVILYLYEDDSGGPDYQMLYCYKEPNLKAYNLPSLNQTISMSDAELVLQQLITYWGPPTAALT